MKNDCWQPAVSLEILRMRAEMLGSIRNFFACRSVLEVTTPALSRAASTDLMLDSLEVNSPANPLNRKYLHTSPELFMKRLLAAGSGPIYQICPVFRDGESGRHHNPEFQMLEWYRPGFVMNDLISEVEALVLNVFDEKGFTTQTIRYRDLFMQVTGLCPVKASVDELGKWALDSGINVNPDVIGNQRDIWLQLIMSYAVEPSLNSQQLTFVTHFPASQAALAKIDPDDPEVALRFELYLGGMELANGFEELTCAGEQKKRFESDINQRKQQGKAEVPMDKHFLAALENGMPESSGVAIGLDRLLMIKAGASHINQVIAFPEERV